MAALSPLDAVHLSGLLAIFLIAGVVSGLAGFAFAAVSAAALWILPPTHAVTLVFALSTCIQIVMVVVLREDMRWLPSGQGESALPYIAGGLLGSPIGLAILTGLRPSVLSGLVGGFLLAYSIANLTFLAHLRIAPLGLRGATGAGLLGGIVGGFSGFPGSIPVIYLSLLGSRKNEIRGVSQPYILTMQIFSLLLLAIRRPAVFQRELGLELLLCAPLAICGAFFGMAAYRRLSDINFRRIVFFLLAFSGLSLILKALSS